jgi:hypothetical protein
MVESKKWKVIRHTARYSGEFVSGGSDQNTGFGPINEPQNIE